MPDWLAYVRERLSGLRLEPQREEEIIFELAGHLEDACEELKQRGVPVGEAARRVCGEVPDWAELARKIRRAKREEDTMNERIRKIWLPGMTTLAVSMGALFLGIRAGLRPEFVWITPKVSLLFYYPWLVTLPLVGALGACWSRRAGGDLRARVLVGVFPVAALLAMFLLLLPLSFVIDPQVRLSLRLLSFAVFVVNWVLVPGAGLVVGAAAFLRGAARQLPTREA